MGEKQAQIQGSWNQQKLNKYHRISSVSITSSQEEHIRKNQ